MRDEVWLEMRFRIMILEHLADPSAKGGGLWTPPQRARCGGGLCGILQGLACVQAQGGVGAAGNAKGVNTTEIEYQQHPKRNSVALLH